MGKNSAIHCNIPVIQASRLSLVIWCLTSHLNEILRNYRVEFIRRFFGNVGNIALYRLYQKQIVKCEQHYLSMNEARKLLCSEFSNAQNPHKAMAP
jgi:hypothetical protein